MKYSYNWLKELSGTKKSPDQIARLLMMHAFEAEEVVKYEHGLEDVVIGKVESLDAHPKADGLRVAQVRINRTTVNQIVCGAPNIEAGQMVAVVLPGKHVTWRSGNQGSKTPRYSFKWYDLLSS